MKTHPTSKNLIILALAAALSATAVMPALAQTSEAPIGETQPAQAAEPLTLEVTDAVNLETQIQAAIDLLAQAEHAGKTVVITITTAQDQRMPDKIKANGKIVIVGAKDVKAGTVDGDPSAGRTKLSIKGFFSTSGNPSDGVRIESPVEFRGVEFNAHTRFATIKSDLTIKNSVFTFDSTSYGVVPLLHLGFSSTDHKTRLASTLVFEDNAVTGFGLIGSSSSAAPQTTIANNTFAFVPMVNTEFLALRGTKAPAPVVISGNSFTATGPHGRGADLKIAQSNVHVLKNTFSAHTPSAKQTHILLENPTSFSGAPVTSVKIEQNTFSGLVALANPVQTWQNNPPFAAGDVVFTLNDVSASKGVMPVEGALKNPNNDKVIDATRNYWGDLPRDQSTANTEEPLDKPYEEPQPEPEPEPEPPVKPADPPVVVPGPQPEVKPASPVIEYSRISGASRVETAVAVSQADFVKGAPVVVLARADVHADSASAVPLAKHLNAPVLLTAPDELHGATLAEMKRLKATKVVIMGGHVAVSDAVEAELVKAGLVVERLDGENRAATAVKTAQMLAQAGKVKQVLVADGFDWQPNMIAGPAAAMVEGVTLLTNGDKVAPETEAFLTAHKVATTAIGDKAKVALKADKAVEGVDGVALSVAVAAAFFGQKAPAAGVATTADFADALVGGAHVARRSGPLLLSPQTIAAPVVDWVKGAQGDRAVFVYGGETRFADKEMDRLK